ncbi:ubiquitin elongating factor core-domain-containing protein [Hygrophoropsis aurantiaca]|uniref:Ubiquitin elongating factor core-domain-containing protein n=1 Tax=Hygrophoropsis aurantiaca TaxID=72124 RepID=A0ACB8APG0_9AGAM|nr:ubiquitin elongating factor core-domain-containing protein [Hygrophoropsis aurantiaca]
MSDPQEDADRIRAKRLAKLQGLGSSAVTPPSGSSSSAPSAKPTTPTQPGVPQSSTTKPTTPRIPAHSRPKSPPSVPPQAKRKPIAAPLKVDFAVWEDETISEILKVTLSKAVAERTGYDIVWLKPLEEELTSENNGQVKPIPLSGEIADRLLISRLELDPQAMSDDLEYVSVLASLPSQMTIFEYLIGCWRRLKATRTSLIKKSRVDEMQRALDTLEKIRDLIISYAGLCLQEPDMFPQPAGRVVGPAELVTPLLSLSALSAPLLSSSAGESTGLLSSEVEDFLTDLAKRFEPDNELDGILAPVVRQLAFHESLFRPEGLGAGDSSWRSVIGGFEALVSVKSIAIMLTRLEEWNPPSATAPTIEKISIMGPLCRLGVFSREWPSIGLTYFSDPSKRSKNDVDSTYASLRGTLKSLQGSLFNIFNTLVRASPASREAVLQYFASVVNLNVRRGGMQVEMETVATDSFMMNLQAVMLRFAEPFMDAKYTKIDRIDPLYYSVSSRVDLREETRIKATSDEATEWVEQSKTKAAPPNFISDVFYLSIALSHYGYLRTIQTYEDLAKHVDELQRHSDMLSGDNSWMGTPFQARTEAAINQVKNEMAKIQSHQLAFRVQLLDPELVFRYIGFTNFISTWLIRSVDPRKSHPDLTIELPLPKDVPMSFRVLPEYAIEDVVDYLLFVVRHSPDSLDLSGKNELIIFALTFLTSTWYIKNPFLKAKINEVLFYGVLPYGYESHGILGALLNSHPIALKHLIQALTHFYIEVEQTGASSQFYDKFSNRRNIAYILKAVWDNPVHRDALNAEALNVDKFVRFINLMINDVTYLMDESLSELTQIHNIQTEMANEATWAAQPASYRREREGTLRSLERHASGYTTLGKSTVGLLKDFTAQTKAPFMMPEIVDKLAAMLDYNLEALVGPKCQELRVKDPEKYKFSPRELLSDILQVFLNLSDQGEFARAVANDGRSYRKSLFERAAYVAKEKTLKSETEIQQLLMFVVKVEETKATIEAEEDLGDIPDEFLDPLMFTLMRDPVILPSSRAVIDRSTIKSHLLSDTKDPFNRMPLTIEEVIPNLELKAQIDVFLSERRNKNTALDKPAEEVVDMDITMK